MASARTVTALLAGAALLASAQARACSRPLNMVSEEWPPYSFTNEDNLQTGLDMDMAKAILKEAGCTLVTAPPLPTVRRMLLFERGDFNLMLAATDTQERRRFARFSDAYRSETVALFVLARDYARYAGIGGMAALARGESAVLAPRVGWYGADFARAAPSLRASGRLFDFGTFEQGMRMLGAGRAPLIMGDRAAVLYEAQRQKLVLRQLPFVVHQAPVHLMLSRASTTDDDLARINAAIARLEKNGTLQALRERYGLR
ncbi:substrate-binding periplasmic protein [Massilia antarctica]|uniref:substrate-binding periplasmic protein n=1 Tax=Massilia antarctica TaxID=2765360 RepID=UPI0006BB5FA7|nr:transporter substrate-binding domain-containing protein [Massilia sp. H27-R4]MCY0914092.1 transporter substrate-binding domain-containing protein [Massilia sp. H27-R4]CUI08490.1 Extracellular solute-binding proteins, family 3 protein [Janthinobacterium sp. CG23_2]CUU32276.1 Extracellular solute-binding proteins, family 3 protein [Janthinobacterium sp. CG23_2]